tara:strand:+ start:5872 stop:6108 length:237 start_codon:yes stop_codon:yes gene_type:complete
MLTPEQVAEIRCWADPLSGIQPGFVYSRMATRMLADLLADRAGIAQELERIQLGFTVSSCGYCHATDRALTALIERIK